MIIIIIKKRDNNNYSFSYINIVFTLLLLQLIKINKKCCSRQRKPHIRGKKEEPGVEQSISHYKYNLSQSRKEESKEKIRKRRLKKRLYANQVIEQANNITTTSITAICQKGHSMYYGILLDLKGITHLRRLFDKSLLITRASIMSPY